MDGWIDGWMDAWMDGSVCPSVCLSVYLSVYLSICLSVYPSMHRSIHPSIYVPTCLRVYVSMYLCIYVCRSVSYVHLIRTAQRPGGVNRRHQHSSPVARHFVPWRSIDPCRPRPAAAKTQLPRSPAWPQCRSLG